MKRKLAAIRSGSCAGPLLSLFLAPVFLLSFAAALSHASDISIIYNGSRLSAHVSGARLIDVMKTLSDQCGVTVSVDSSIQSQKISVQFDNVKLEDGVKRLVNPYNSAMIFTKETDPEGRDNFYLSQLKVFDEDSAAATYVNVSEMDKKQDQSVERTSFSGETYRAKEMADRIRSTPNERKNAARAAATNKKISASVRRTQVTKTLAQLRQAKSRKRAEEATVQRQIEEARNKLNGASEQELQHIQAQISSYSAKLSSTRARNTEEIKRLERELTQLRKGTI